MHARALGAVAVGAPVRRLPAALACDAAPHLHRNAGFRAPPDVAAQLLSGPFWGSRPEEREGTRSKYGLGLMKSATKVILWAEAGGEACQGWDTIELTLGRVKPRVMVLRKLPSDMLCAPIECSQLQVLRPWGPPSPLGSLNSAFPFCFSLSSFLSFLESLSVLGFPDLLSLFWISYQTQRLPLCCPRKTPLEA